MHSAPESPGNGNQSFDASLWLHPQFVDAIARRLLELARGLAPEDPSPPAELLKVGEVAKRLRVSPKWVYDHQNDLGVIKLGGGRKPRLRFDPGAIDGHVEPAPQPQPAQGSTAPREEAKRTRRRLASRPIPPDAHGQRRS